MILTKDKKGLTKNELKEILSEYNIGKLIEIKIFQKGQAHNNYLIK